MLSELERSAGLRTGRGSGAVGLSVSYTWQLAGGSTWVYIYIHKLKDIWRL